MKIKLISVCIIATLMAACSKDETAGKTSTTGLSYSESYNKWLGFKQSSNNNYFYVATTSSFTGLYTETKITVQNGVVVGRDYTGHIPSQVTFGQYTLKQWSETSATLNTHNNEGAEILTLDEVYKKASTVWLKADLNTNNIYLDTNNNGLISNCGYFPIGCQDDCFVGITIKNINVI